MGNISTSFFHTAMAGQKEKIEEIARLIESLDSDGRLEFASVKQNSTHEIDGGYNPVFVYTATVLSYDEGKRLFLDLEQDQRVLQMGGKGIENGPSGFIRDIAEKFELCLLYTDEGESADYFHLMVYDKGKLVVDARDKFFSALAVQYKPDIELWIEYFTGRFIGKTEEAEKAIAQCKLFFGEETMRKAIISRLWELMTKENPWETTIKGNQKKETKGGK